MTPSGSSPDSAAVDLCRCAYHEAGHAVAYLMTGMSDIRARIPDDDHPHEAFTIAAPPEVHDPRQRIRRCMAGVASETFVLGLSSPSPGADRDWNCVQVELAKLAETEGGREPVYEALWREMHVAFERPDVQAAVRAIAAEILERRELGDADLRRLAGAAGLCTKLPLTPPHT